MRILYGDLRITFTALKQRAAIMIAFSAARPESYFRRLQVTYRSRVTRKLRHVLP